MNLYMDQQVGYLFVVYLEEGHTDKPLRASVCCVLDVLKDLDTTMMRCETMKGIMQGDAQLF